MGACLITPARSLECSLGPLKGAIYRRHGACNGVAQAAPMARHQASRRLLGSVLSMPSEHAREERPSAHQARPRADIHERPQMRLLAWAAIIRPQASARGLSFATGCMLFARSLRYILLVRASVATPLRHCEQVSHPPQHSAGAPIADDVFLPSIAVAAGRVGGRSPIVVGRLHGAHGRSARARLRRTLPAALLRARFAWSLRDWRPCGRHPPSSLTRTPECSGHAGEDLQSFCVFIGAGGTEGVLCFFASVVLGSARVER